MKKWIPISVLLNLALIVSVQGQNISMSNGTSSQCTGFFFDSGGGGTASPYAPNENFTYTICPSAGSFVSVNFFAFQLGTGDLLTVYNGNSTTAPVMGVYTSATITPGLLAATPATNPSGCLTFVFTSDGANEGNGWAADISCVPPCQTFYTRIDSLSPDTTGPAGEIDMCIGDTVKIWASGDYVMNNTWYFQQDSTTTFDWYLLSAFGDTLINQNGDYFELPIDSSGGFVLRLLMEDTIGCPHVQIWERIIRVSTEPDFSATTVASDTICFLDSNTLVGRVSSQPWTSFIPPFSGDSIFLPDGSGANPGVYTSNMVISSFPQGQAINSVNDIADVVVNMEHSFLGDLSITLGCPNGSSVVLKQFPGGGGRWLGEACDQSLGVPGIGWDYTWPGNTVPALGTMNAISGACIPCQNVMNPCNGFFGTALPQSTYAAISPWTNLVGCPINGTWTLTIVDQWGIDDGFLFDWTIQFDTSILPPTVINYDPGVDTSWWSFDSSIVGNFGDSIIVQPTVFDTVVEYTYNMTDDFGCTYDTTLEFFVRSPCDAICATYIPTMGSFPDACSGDSSGYAWAEPVFGVSPPPYDFYWTDAAGDTVGTSTGKYTSDTLFSMPTGTYAVIVVDSFGCEISNTVVVGEVPPIQLQIVNPQLTSCAGNFCDGQATVQVLAGGTVPYAYLWPGGDTAGTATTLCSGSNVVTVTDARGCQETDTVQINEPDSIRVTASGSDTICVSNVHPISALATGGGAPYTYTWNQGVGNGAAQNVSPSVTTTYRVIATDTNLCPADTDFVTVYVREPLDARVDPVDTICPYDDIDLVAVGGGGDGQYTFQWSHGAFGDTVNVSPDTSLYYVVTVTDACGTQPGAVDSVWVQVGGYRPLEVAVNPDDTVCVGEPFALYAAAVGGDERFTYTWDQGLGVGQFHTVISAETKTYTVTVTDECLTPAGTSSITLHVGNFREFEASVDTSEHCQPGSFVFGLDSNLVGFRYFWDFGEGYTEYRSWDSIRHTFEAAGCHDVNVRVRTDLGCVTEKTYPCMVRVIQNPRPEFSFTPLQPTHIEPFVNFHNETTKATQVAWYIQDTLYTQSRNFTVAFPDSGWYSVKLVARNDYGCVDSLTKQILVDYETMIWFPSAFTPNGDNLNDVFKPEGEGILSTGYRMRIFDRWGKLVFETTNPAEGWDGTYFGNEAENGQYIYDIEYKLHTERSIHERGGIQLIR